MFDDVKIGAWTLTPLTLAKIFLAAYLVGMFVVGKKTMLWPVMNWPMYSAREFSFPPPTTSAFEIAAVTVKGDAITIPMGRLVTTGREVALVPVFQCAAGIERRDQGWKRPPTSQEDCRIYISTLLRRVLSGVQIETIEISEIVWAVDPLASRPVDADAPIERKVLARFDVHAGPSTGRGEGS